MAGIRLNSSFKATIWYTVSTILLKCLTLISTPLFTRLLSVDEFGLYSNYYSWHSMLYVIVTLSLSSSINSAMISFKEERDGYISSLVVLNLTICGGIALVMALFSGPISAFFHIDPRLLWIMALTYCFEPILSFFSFRQRFENHYKLASLLNVMTPVIAFLLALSLVLSTDVDRYFYRIVGERLPAIILGAGLAVFLLIKGKCLFRKKFWRFALAFCIPLVPHYLSLNLLSTSDRIMITHFCGEAYTGIYTVGYTVAGICNLVHDSVHIAWVPWMYPKLEQGRYDVIRLMSKPYFMLGGIMAVGAVAFGPEIVAILAPSAFHGAVWVVMPVVFGVYLQLVYTQFGSVELYHGKTVRIAAATLAAALVNVVLNALLLPVFGYVAAGYTTMVSYLMLCLFHYRFMKKCEPNPVYDMRFVVWFSLAVFALSAVFMLLYSFLIIRIVLFLLISAAAFWWKHNEIRELISTYFLERKQSENSRQ